MNPLTRLQAAILAAISDSMSTRGYPPTVTELGRTVGLASRDRVIRQLRILRLKGHLEPVPGSSQVRIHSPQETSR
jgi:repressor LexA